MITEFKNIDKFYGKGYEFMFTYDIEITNYFFNLIQGKITLQEFSSWVYSSAELFDLLGLDKYCELTAVDYNGVFAAADIEKLIEDFYKNSKIGLNNEIMLWILESMVAGTYDLVEGCSSLARMQSFEKGFEYLPIEFVGYDSVIEDLGYHYKEDKDKAEVDRVIDLYKKEMLRVTIEFLEKIKLEQSILIRN